MNDEIELHWTLKVDYTFEKYHLFEALVNLCLAYNGDIPEEYDYAEFIIIWLGVLDKQWISLCCEKVCRR